MNYSGGTSHETGDKGQRYEVRMIGYPREGENRLGWSADRVGALDMMRAILKAPGCTSATVFDRQDGLVIARSDNV